MINFFFSTAFDVLHRYSAVLCFLSCSLYNLSKYDYIYFLIRVFYIYVS
jgi:hypothetical protein